MSAVLAALFRTGLGVALVAASAACASSAEPSLATDVAPTEPTRAPAPKTTATPEPEPAPATHTFVQPVVAEVERELALVKESHYQHTTHVVEAQGVFDVDCSGFLDYVLGHALPAQFAALTAATKARPLAEDFVAFLAAPTTGWVNVATVAELVPGDVVAWLEAPGGSDTGHVMVVRALPRSRDDSSFIVPVWDSVNAPHGSTDSRSAAGTTGLGSGEIVLIVDDDGAPIAHEWSDGAAKITQQTSLGRVQ